MQITKAEVTPIELKLRQPVRMAGRPEISQITAIFVRIETRQGQNAWGCTVANPDLTGENRKMSSGLARSVLFSHPTYIR